MAASLQELAPQLTGIDAMLGDFAAGQENYRHIEIVAFLQFGIGINIDFA